MGVMAALLDPREREFANLAMQFAQARQGDRR
jgi:hypothetical protein